MLQHFRIIANHLITFKYAFKKFVCLCYSSAAATCICKWLCVCVRRPVYVWALLDSFAVCATSVACHNIDIKCMHFRLIFKIDVMVFPSGCTAKKENTKIAYLWKKEMKINGNTCNVFVSLRNSRIEAI